MASDDFEPRSLNLWRVLLGPALALVVYAVPLNLAPDAHRLLAVLTLAVCYWISEAIPPPATTLLATALCISLGLGNAGSAFAPFSDPVIFLFMGSFMVARAMQVHGLDRRFALATLSLEWAKRGPFRLLFAMGLVSCVISLFISNTATTAMMLPIGTGVLSSLNRGIETPKTRFSIAMMLMLTWGASVAVGLPIGSPPNLIAISLSARMTDQPISFADWIKVGLPLTAAMLGLCYLLLSRMYRDPSIQTVGLSNYVSAERQELGPWTRGQKSVAFVFVALSILWLAPGILAGVLGKDHSATLWADARFPESLAAVFAACLLFILPGKEGKPALTWREASKIEWGTIVLFGGGLALGKFMFETKLADAVGHAFTIALGINDLWGITAAAIVLGIVMSEAASNTASASAVIPAVIAVAQAAGVSTTPPILGAALGASFGFMLPVSTPPNAIVYSSGLVPLREMIRAGIWLDISGAVLIWVGLRVLCPLLGMT